MITPAAIRKSCVPRSTPAMPFSPRRASNITARAKGATSIKCTAVHTIASRFTFRINAEYNEKQNISDMEISGAEPNPLPDTAIPARIKTVAAPSCQVNFSLKIKIPR